MGEPDRGPHVCGHGRQQPGEGQDLLGSREHAAANTAIRTEVLDGYRPALTVVLAGIWDPSWLIEIEAIAAA